MFCRKYNGILQEEKAMNMPLESLEIDLRNFEGCDEATKQLAHFCAELLEVLKYTLSI